MLTARTPFDSDSAPSLKNKHALELPVESPTSILTDRPGDLDEVIERCLEKNPKDRFDSLEKLMERLQVFPGAYNCVWPPPKLLAKNRR
ncbi:MAG: hypothetical protein R3D26_20440 [Cyanobacteriota/Melainabacteria group bacterium]